MATLIRTATQLQNMNLDLTANYELGSDIYWSGAFDPVGGWGGAAPFTGSLNGKGYTIHNLSVQKIPDDYVGLFGQIDGATIQNVRLENVDVDGDDHVGALIGEAIGNSEIPNCSSTGTVNGDQYTGGLIGLAYQSTIPDCRSSVVVVATGWCAGGLIGALGVCTLIRSKAFGSVSNSGGNTQTGGLIGYTYTSGLVSRCYATGNVVSDDDFVGGLIGESRIDVEDCYARGAVTGVNQVGGLAGLITAGIVDDSYSTGAVVGVIDVGGLIGWNPGGTVNNSFWDILTSGQAASDGGTGKTTSQMKNVATFQAAGWAISTIWNVLATCNNGYPCLIDVNDCCVASTPLVDQTIVGNKVSLEAIRNIEFVYGGRAYIGKAGDFVYESRYHRNV